MNNDRLYDNDLLRKISEGDMRSFNLLFERHRNRLYTYLYKITRSAQAAEEMVLDVFVKIWNGRETLAQIENWDAFLYRIAHNRAIDFLRSLKRSPALQQKVLDAMHEPLSEDHADNQLLLKNAEAVIGKAVRHLSPQRQQVFLLHHYQSFTNDEIAQKLHLSKNTVRNHLAASVEFIRKFLSRNLSLLLLLVLLKK